MDQSARLKLPYIIANQAQKHVTHNEAVRMLDCLVQPVVQSRALATPPASPAEGAAYVVAAGGAGVWAGHDNEIACYADGAWSFFVPAVGWQMFDAESRQRLAFSGTGWAPDEGGSARKMFGINTEADTINRLAVKSDAVLLSHDDLTPGTGDMRAKLNKADTTKTASVLFQTGFSGRAEFGLAGDDDFHVKVSADGAGWHEALVVARDTGEAGFPHALDLAEVSAPADPAAGHHKLYVKGDGRLYKKDSSGAETPLVGGSTGSSDNRLLRSDGTDGATVQASPIAVDDDGDITSFGGQIAFPATQNASTGANVLDDYEEGTFTPALDFGGNSSGITYGSLSGRYIKIGRLVHIIGTFTLASKGSSGGSANISGLPYSPDNVFGGETPILIGYWSGFTGLSGPLKALLGLSGAISLRQVTSGGTSQISDSVFTDSSRIYFSGGYLTDN